MKDKIQVLIISQYFPPDISGGGTRSFNYGRCLLQKNYDVTVITAYPHLHSKVPKEYRHKIIHKEKMCGLNLIRVWIPSLLHTSAKNRIILHASFIFFSLLPIFSMKPTIVFASEPNLFSFIPAYFYAKLRGAKVIRVVDDLWPEAIYERGYVKSKIVKKLLNKLAKSSYSFPEYILPLTEEAKELIHKSYDINENKIIVLTHGVDIDAYRQIENPNNRDFVLMYSGSLVESYDFDLIIKAAKKLTDMNITFVIRGRGPLLLHLKKQKEKHQLTNLWIDDEIVPLDKISDILTKADVLLVPMKNEYALNITLPTKILEYQAVGKPIICCSGGAPGNYVERTKSGIRVDYGDLEGFVNAIMKLKSDHQLRITLGKNGRRFVEENLTYSKIGDKLSELIRNIISQN